MFVYLSNIFDYKTIMAELAAGICCKCLAGTAMQGYTKSQKSFCIDGFFVE